MRSLCPGQDNRFLSVDPYKCPSCGAENEIFSSEVKVKCDQCGETVYRDRMPSCVDWCAAARDCVGEEKWQQLKGSE